MASAGWRLGVAAEQLAVADDALALGADVDEDLVLVDPDDAAFDDVAVLEALDVRVLLGEQLLHRRRLGTEVAGRRGRLVLGRGGRIGGLGSERSSTVVSGAGLGSLGDGLLGRRLRARPRRRQRGVGDSAAASAAGTGLASVAAAASAGRSVSAEAALSGAASSAAAAPRSRRRPMPRWSRVPRSRASSAGASATASGLVGGLVGDGDGCRCVLIGDGGGRLRLRRGPALLLFGQLVGLSCRRAPRESERPERRSGRWETIKWSVVAGPRSAPSCRMALVTLFNCPAPRAGRV